jgi:hypothetical protein
MKKGRSGKREADFGNWATNTKTDCKRDHYVRGSVVEITSKANSPFIFPVKLSPCSYLYA